MLTTFSAIFSGYFGGSESFLKSPASLKPFGYSTSIEVKAVAPLNRSQGLSSKCIPHVGSSVSAIGLWSYPPTIVRGVITFIINTVKLVLRSRSTSHGFEESLKGSKPRFTDLNAPTPVIRELGIVWVSAPTLHSSPNIVFRTVRHAVLEVVRVVNEVVMFLHKARYITRTTKSINLKRS